MIRWAPRFTSDGASMSTIDTGIFIEARKVKYAGMSTSFTHLYLVYRDTDGQEYVLRAGPQSSLFPLVGNLRVESNVAMSLSADKRSLDDATLKARHSTALDFGTLSDDEAWALMVKYARAIDAADTPYELFEENSNAFVGALLEAALDAGGLTSWDPDDLLPATVSRSSAVGIDHYDDLMARVKQPADGALRGTDGANTLNGIQVAETIYAMGGDDTVSAGRGADRVWGGAGNDRLSGGQGDDRLWGEAGADTLTGGEGRDEMWAGTDAVRDTFVFAALSDSAVGVARDVLREFRAPAFAGDAAGDLIDLRGIDAQAGLTGDQAFRFSSGAAANAVWVTAVVGTTDLIVRADATGDAVADLEIRVAGVVSLTADAFML